MPAATDRQLRVLAFEPFDGGSHRAAREAISRHSTHHWTWVCRPPRDWKWRMRIGAFELLHMASEQGALDEPIDLIFVTSLASAADLRAMLPVHLRNVPLVLYMHENQAAYPSREHVTAQEQQRDVHFALTNLTSALAADRVLWNSAWNRDSFLDGMEQILRAYAGSRDVETGLRHSTWRRDIANKSGICWPPIEVPDRVLHNADGARKDAREDGVTRVVWPHRWEHDKGPDELLAIARKLEDDPSIRWIILGEQYRTVPPALHDFRERFGPSGLDRIDHMGFVESREAYWLWLEQADWVLSTARHEYFGMAVVEAMLAGCLPWLPQRLSYPELLPDHAMFELSPAKPINPYDAAECRAAIQQHLQPALARNAVQVIDAQLGRVVNRSPDDASRSPSPKSIQGPIR